MNLKEEEEKRKKERKQERKERKKSNIKERKNKKEIKKERKKRRIKCAKKLCGEFLLLVIYKTYHFNNYYLWVLKSDKI